MIELQRVGFGYKERADEILRDVNLVCRAGEITLICGATGSGKSTLLSLMAGLAPRFTGGSLTGKILIDGSNLFENRASQKPQVIGYVSQQSEGSFVAETVGDELAFALEQMGTPVEQMQSRVEATADLVGLGGLLGRPVEKLSGGQQQRLAIGSAIIASPRVLLLDEPTSELDDAGASMLLGLLRKLADELGIAVVIAEHHLERLIESCERVVIVENDGLVASHERAKGAEAAAGLNLMPHRNSETNLTRANAEQQDSVRRTAALQEKPALRVSNLTVGHGAETLVEDLNYELAPGDAIGLVGPNGSGKTSVLLTLVGELEARAGLIELSGQALLVPQNAGDLLYLDSVSAELSAATKRRSHPTEDRRLAIELLDDWVGPLTGNTHPRDLSSGQQLALALAIQLSSGADILLLDEPTRGLDYRAKSKLAESINELRLKGIAFLIASHDLKFLESVSARLVRLGA